MSLVVCFPIFCSSFLSFFFSISRRISPGKEERKKKQKMQTMTNSQRQAQHAILLSFWNRMPVFGFRIGLRLAHSSSGSHFLVFERKCEKNVRAPGRPARCLPFRLQALLFLFPKDIKEKKKGRPKEDRRPGTIFLLESSRLRTSFAFLFFLSASRCVSRGFGRCVTTKRKKDKEMVGVLFSLSFSAPRALLFSKEPVRYATKRRRKRKKIETPTACRLMNCFGPNGRWVSILISWKPKPSVDHSERCQR